MTKTSICLLGKMCVRRNEQVINSTERSKAQELLGYLLLYRDRPHSRESLAGLLWCDAPGEQSKKYLRQSLWQLQHLIGSQSTTDNLLFVDSRWIQLNQKCHYWLDLDVFERVYEQVKGVPGYQLNNEMAEALRGAVSLYKGDLLEGCYQDWCLYERERLHSMYLAMLDKLVGYSEAHGDYEAGLEYGMRILRHDRAREQTHRKMMRLHYLAGDRTGALHQYERCVAALHEELNVRPAQGTVELFEQICADEFAVSEMMTNRSDAEPLASRTPEQPGIGLSEILDRLTRLQVILAGVQSQVRREIQAIRIRLNLRG